MSTNYKEISSELWAITAYFNVSGSASRLENYRRFRRFLTVPVLTVEWNPFGAYQLTESDADLLLQMGGGDLMWQKERLLEIALPALPTHVKYVAWLDCDVVFLDPDWSAKASLLLERHPIIQPFEKVVYLDEAATRSLANQTLFHPDALDHSLPPLPERPSFLHLFDTVGDEITRLDLAQRFVQAQPHRPRRDRPYESVYMARPAHGHAWAARLEFLRRVHLYDRCIMGSGDLFLCYGLIGKSHELIENHRSVGWDFYDGGESYRAWSATASEACRGQLKGGTGKILHLFHGSIGHRQYKTRIDGLVDFRLDIDRDISAEENRPWSWKRQRDELNRYFLDYMKNRRDDG